MTLSHGVYEGHPALWTRREAWVCADRKWHPFSLTDAVHYAAVLTKADFTDRYRHLPALPSNAFHSEQSDDDQNKTRN